LGSSDKLPSVPGSPRIESNFVRSRSAARGEPLLAQTELGWNVDLEAYLAACPASATTRGTFFEHVCNHVREGLGEAPPALFEGVTQRPWSPFHSYPLSDFMRLAHNAAILLYPDRATAEGLRRIGWLSYKSFMSTMPGRVVLFALGTRFEDVISVAPTAYRIALPASVVRLERVGARRCRFEVRNVHSFVDSYHTGVLEGTCAAFGLQPILNVRRLSRICDADFDLSW
jgi:uncharacterized protein (TIGR02265 family)